MLAQLETRLREETGIPKLKIGFNHVFGYFIEVSNSYKSMVPDNYTRKQTLTTGERYITPELKTLENKILGAHERLISLEHRLFADLLDGISRELDRIQRTARAVAQLDVFVSLAAVAADNNYCRPVVDDSDRLFIREGRHPVVEQVLKGSLFVPNDTELDCGENRCLIITGPNMAGKSTYMRQNALIVLMAQIGSFVPAAECHVGIVDAVFTRVGASDDLAAGQSTFMVEMTEVAEILKNATRRSLVILDEIGRGEHRPRGGRAHRQPPERLGLQDPVCHPLPRADRPGRGGRGGQKLQHRSQEAGRGHHLPAADCPRPRRRQLRHRSGKTCRPARQRHPPGPRGAAQTGGCRPQKQCGAGEMVEKLEALDLETLTPIEALNFLYELKKTLKGSISG